MQKLIVEIDSISSDICDYISYFIWQLFINKYRNNVNPDGHKGYTIGLTQQIKRLKPED